ECSASEDGAHRWGSPHELVGGIKENPGVWGGPGCSIRSTSVCLHCGLAYMRRSNSQGCNTEYDHDEERYSASEDDGAVSVDELAKHHGLHYPNDLRAHSPLGRRILLERAWDDCRSVLEDYADRVERGEDGEIILHGFYQSDYV